MPNVVLLRFSKKRDSINTLGNRFIAILGNQGFGYAEGFTADIGFEADSNESVLHIFYRKDGKEGEEPFVFDDDVPLEIIHEIAEGK